MTVTAGPARRGGHLDQQRRELLAVAGSPPRRIEAEDRADEERIAAVVGCALIAPGLVGMAPGHVAALAAARRVSPSSARFRIRAAERASSCAPAVVIRYGRRRQSGGGRCRPQRLVMMRPAAARRVAAADWTKAAASGPVARRGAFPCCWSSARLHARFRDLGVPVTTPLTDRPWGMRDFVIEIPGGHRLAFGERMPRRPG